MLKAFLKPKADRIRNYVSSRVDQRTYDSLLLQGRQASWQVRAKKNISSLADVEFRVFSQWGEDGIIDWIIERANLPHYLQTFIEFGVESYDESNTRFLLENRLWKGFVIDADPELHKNLSRNSHYWRYNLKDKSAFINCENINDLIVGAGFSGNIGLLSIDIDGNDYWVWDAISVVNPVICVCEYNSHFGNLHSVSIPYDPEFVWGKKHKLLYYGASIQALSSLARRKGYKFLGTTTAGNNAFFIREDYSSWVAGGLDRAISYPSCLSSSIVVGPAPAIELCDAYKEIQDLPIVQTDDGQVVSLRSLGRIHDEIWLQRMSKKAIAL